MEVNRRDRGLVRAVGTRGLAASIISIVVGAGIFAVPGALAASIGPYAPIAILVCAIAIGSVAICFAEAGSRIASSGGVYGCIQAAFGPLTGYVAGMLLWICCVLACGGVAAALALTRFMTSQISGIRPSDPLTFGAVTLLLSVVALLACYLPARRASKVDPMVALRYE